MPKRASWFISITKEEGRQLIVRERLYKIILEQNEMEKEREYEVVGHVESHQEPLLIRVNFTRITNKKKKICLNYDKLDQLYFKANVL